MINHPTLPDLIKSLRVSLSVLVSLHLYINYMNSIACMYQTVFCKRVHLFAKVWHVEGIRCSSRIQRKRQYIR